MKTNFKFRLPYERVREGWFSDALVQYHVRDDEVKTVVEEDGGLAYWDYVSKTEHYLTFDLWLFRLRFVWLKDHKQPKFPGPRDDIHR